MSTETETKALAELLYRNEHRRTSFAHKLSWHEETAETVLEELKSRGWTPPPTVDTPTDTWRNNLSHAAAQIRTVLSAPASDLTRAQRVGAIEQADAYLTSHRKTEVWSLINRLRDELVRA